MPRAPFQVLVLPYRKLADGRILFAVLRRNSKTGGYWQGIAGGGEDNETPLDAAKREAAEEAGISPMSCFLLLESKVTIPVVNVCGFKWGRETLVIPEFAFGVEVEDQEIVLSKEHSEFKWLPFEYAYKELYWDSNKNALWELNHRLENNVYNSLCADSAQEDGSVRPDTN